MSTTGHSSPNQPLGYQIEKIQESSIRHLEDKQIHFLRLAKEALLQKRWQRTRRWFWLSVIGFWLLLPPIVWFWKRRHAPEASQILAIEKTIESVRAEQGPRKFWHRLSRKKRNQLRSKDSFKIQQFYQTLIRTAKQYNMRVDLFHYALDRQAKKLDSPFTVTELEGIENTFQRIRDEVLSAMKLLEVAERNPEMDLGDLLKDRFSGIDPSYLTRSMDMSHSGKFAQELLILESSVRDELSQLVQSQ